MLSSDVSKKTRYEQSILSINSKDSTWDGYSLRDSPNVKKNRPSLIIKDHES